MADARGAGYILLVEGESDTRTLWHYGIPALGIPGAATWKADWAQYLDGLAVYVWKEPDMGGETFVTKVGATLPDVRILEAPAGRKDVSECHVLGDDVPALLRRLMAKAKPYKELCATHLAKEAKDARESAGDLMTCPNILERLVGLTRQLGLVGEERAVKLLYLALTSRLLDTPVSVAVKGPSAGGKSFIVETVLRAFPESAYLSFTGMSERAIIYDERPVDHRFIVLYEASGLGVDRPGEPSVLAYCVHSLLSEGCIRYVTVEKTLEGMVPRRIERQGPTGLITTTTWASLHPENETRMLSVTIRDDAAQTRGVFTALAERANGHNSGSPDLRQWRALQRWLELAGEREVTIPYAMALAEKAKPAAVRLRRDFGKLLTLIKAHALLHQASRGRDDQGRIVATLEDYAAVYNLVADLMAEGVGATVSPTVRETVEAVRVLYAEKKEPVTLAELAKRLGLDRSTANRRVLVARELGHVVNLEERWGKPSRLAPGDPLPEETPILPAPEALEEAQPSAHEGVKKIFPFTPRESLHSCTARTAARKPKALPACALGPQSLRLRSSPSIGILRLGMMGTMASSLVATRALSRSLRPFELLAKRPTSGPYRFACGNTTR